MPDVVGVRFKPVTKIYYFMPPPEAGIELGDPVIVETSRGQELGWVALTTQQVPPQEVKGTLKPVLRKATPIDLMKLQEFQEQEAEAMEICKEKVAELGLPMKVIQAEYSFDGARVLFSFSAEQRVDFRDLVRLLVRSLRARVEMRQVGARDEAKIIDGYGRCGRQLCCASWLTEFHPVSIRMAKNQQLPLAPTEISGLCGRLLCCLAYEDEMYTEIRSTMPKVGTRVGTAQGEGIIKGLNILREMVIVELTSGEGRIEVAVNEMGPPDAPPPPKKETPVEIAEVPVEGEAVDAKKKKRRRRRSRSKKKNQPKSR